MIHPSEITVVMQGDIRSETALAVRSVRSLLPNARLILSTFKTEDIGAISGEVDDVILSDDPGAMPSFIKADILPTNNINRQLISSKAGLDRVHTNYAIKMRTDCVLYSVEFIGFLERFSIGGANPDRLVVSSFFTRHPYGLACYLFHISDWFVCGRSDRVRQFFSVPLMSLEDATWFERHESLKSGTYAARRFRARFTPEQHITTHYAHALGYQIPDYLNHWSTRLAREYEDFLANEVVVVQPSQIGFTIEKYRDIEMNLYQKIDCISFSDWIEIVSRRANKNERSVDSEEMSSYAKRLTRVFANRYRHLIIRLFFLAREIRGYVDVALLRKGTVFISRLGDTMREGKIFNIRKY